MKKTDRFAENNRYFAGMSLIYGILFTIFCYKNLNGITFLLHTAMTVGIAYLFFGRLGMSCRRRFLPYGAGILLLGASTVMTDSGFLVLFNWVGIMLLFMAGMIRCFCGDEEWDFFSYMKEFILMGAKTVVYSFHIFHIRDWRKESMEMWEESGQEENKKKEKTGSVVTGIVIAALLLAVIFPLLASSDRVFAGIFASIFRMPENLNVGSVVGMVCMTLFGVLIIYGVFCAFASGGCRKKEGKDRNYEAVTGITFTVILAVVYVVYCCVQIYVLFLKNEGGLPDGVTYASYAREGFWQLLFVGIINLILVISVVYAFQKNRILKMILTVICGCTFVMTISAMYRMFMYVHVYHMTFLRVLVLWFLILNLVMMTGVVIFIYKETFLLFRFITAVVSCGYILLSFLHPDYLAASYNIRTMEQMTAADAVYMMETSSYDAAPALAKIDVGALDYTDGLYTESIVENIHRQYFRKAQQDIDSRSLREYNFSVWMASRISP